MVIVNFRIIVLLMILGFSFSFGHSSFDDELYHLEIKKDSVDKKIELLRSELLENINKQDSTAIIYTISILDTLKSNNFTSLSPLEKFTIYYQIGEYELSKDNCQIYLDSYNDASHQKKSYNDMLAFYLNNILKDISNNIEKMEKSNASEETKSTLKMMILICTTDYFDLLKIQNEAEDFVKKYPKSRLTLYMKKNLICKFQHLEEREKKKNQKFPYEDKLYTGGFGMNVAVSYPLAMSELGDYFSSSIALYYGLDIQYSRFAFLFDLGLSTLSAKKNIEGNTIEKEEIQKNTQVSSVEFSFSLGWVVFDSQYIKVTPFLGIGFTDYNIWDRKLRMLLHNRSDLISMESYVDYHLGLLLEYRISECIPLQIKYDAKYNTSDFALIETIGFVQSLSFGIGFFFW